MWFFWVGRLLSRGQVGGMQNGKDCNTTSPDVSRS